jgi:hypothetical protein
MSDTRRRRSNTVAWTTTTALVLALGLVGCDNAYPEVVVVNNTGERMLLRDVSFHGCLWSGVLAYGEATSPQRCPPGSDRVHFKKLDTALPASGSTDQAPLWFNYQTISEHEAAYGDFQRLELTLPDMEQDFSTPGPYGH